MKRISLRKACAAALILAASLVSTTTVFVADWQSAYTKDQVNETAFEGKWVETDLGISFFVPVELEMDEANSKGNSISLRSEGDNWIRVSINEYGTDAASFQEWASQLTTLGFGDPYSYVTTINGMEAAFPSSDITLAGTTPAWAEFAFCAGDHFLQGSLNFSEAVTGNEEYKNLVAANFLNSITYDPEKDKKDSPQADTQPAGETVSKDAYTPDQCYEGTHFPKIEVFFPDILEDMKRVNMVGEDYTMPEAAVEKADSGAIYRYTYPDDGRVSEEAVEFIAVNYEIAISDMFELSGGDSRGTSDSLFNFPLNDEYSAYFFYVDGYSGLMLYWGNSWIEKDGENVMTEDREITIRIIRHLPDFFIYDESVSENSLSGADQNTQADESAEEASLQPSEENSDQAVAEASQSAEDKSAEIPQQNLMRSIATLNIRETPSTEAAILGKVEEGHMVDVREDAGDGWVHIIYPDGGNIEGYVKMEYLTAP